MPNLRPETRLPAPREGERLQKVLAQAGFGSRRHCEELIKAGRVAVNGQVVTELGTRVRAQDAIAVDGTPVVIEPKRYYLLYKPRGYLSSVRDPHGDRLAVSLVPAQERLYPVGRLDKESEGLLLFTNDGELTQRLIHPRYEHEKEYLVLVRGPLTEAAFRRLEEGVPLFDEEGRQEATVQARVERQPRTWAWRGELASPGAQWVRIVLTEGRKRQIRRMLEAVGLHVERLIRVRMGMLRLGALEPGEGRWLTPEEVRRLKESVGLAQAKPDEGGKRWGKSPSRWTGRRPRAKVPSARS